MKLGATRCRDPQIFPASETHLGFDRRASVRSTSLPSEVVTVEQLKGLLSRGVVGGSTLVWAEGMTEWSRLGDCHSFFGLAKGAVVGTGGAGGVAKQTSAVDMVASSASSSAQGGGLGGGGTDGDPHRPRSCLEPGPSR